MSAGADDGWDVSDSFLSDLFDSFFTRIEILEGDWTDFEDVEDISNTIMAGLCVLCAGLAAGLTMGLLSLDSTKLELKQMTGTEAEKAAASSLLPIIKRHHLLLVTLLLFNSIANEALPIFLGALMPNYLAVFASVSLILIFGEILPSAFFTGPQQLLTAAKMAGFVWGLMAFFSPIAVPIAKLLDLAFGSDDENRGDGRISRAELEALFVLQGRRSPSMDAGDTNGVGMPAPTYQGYSAAAASPFQAEQQGLHQYEVSILTGILSLSRTKVGDCMIPLSRVYALEASLQPTPELLKTILASGFSRIPIYRSHTTSGGDSLGVSPSPSPSPPRVWLGYLLTKTLIDPSSLPPTLGSHSSNGGNWLREPLFVRPGLGLLEMLALFRQGRSHLALVCADPMAALACMRARLPCVGEAAVLGVVALEDVIERILQSDIVDETDVVDAELMPRGSLQQGGAPTVMFHGFHKARGAGGGRGGGLVNRSSREVLPFEFEQVQPQPQPQPQQQQHERSSLLAGSSGQQLRGTSWAAWLANPLGILTGNV